MVVLPKRQTTGHICPKSNERKSDVKQLFISFFFQSWIKGSFLGRVQRLPVLSQRVYPATTADMLQEQVHANRKTKCVFKTDSTNNLLVSFRQSGHLAAL